MNIRKNIDYSSLYVGIDQALSCGLSQMELYLELGKLVSDRPEKGAAVMAAEYITANYPNRTGFSPRNLRRMRDFFRIYKGYPEILKQAMRVGWTQNIIILKVDLEMDARFWYLLAVQKNGWSKAELAEKIAAGAHLANSDKEEPQNSEQGNLPVKSGLQLKTYHYTTMMVDFLERFWYNRPWKLSLFRQVGIIGEAYG